MRISDRFYQLLMLKQRVHRELEGIGRGRTPISFARQWRLLQLRQRLRAKLNDQTAHPILLH